MCLLSHHLNCQWILFQYVTSDFNPHSPGNRQKDIMIYGIAHAIGTWVFLCFVLLCLFVFLLYLRDLFAHIVQGCVAGTGSVLRLLRCPFKYYRTILLNSAISISEQSIECYIYIYWNLIHVDIYHGNNILELSCRTSMMYTWCHLFLFARAFIHRELDIRSCIGPIRPPLFLRSGKCWPCTLSTENTSTE